MSPLELLLAIGQIGNDALDQAEADLADALQTLKGLGDKDDN